MPLADEEPIYEDPEPRRNPRRGWASPPPWMNRGEGRAADAAGLDPHDPGLDAAEAGLAGSVADRLAASTRGAAAETDSAAGPGSRAQSARTEGHLSDDDLQPAEERDDWDTRADGARNARERAPEPAPRYRERERERARTEPTEPDGRLANARQGIDRTHEVAPSWERPARLEAYPTLRSRRMPNIAFPPILVALVALLLAALILFLLPGFLGLGSPQAGASPTPVTQSSGGPVGSAVPTQIPQATQQILPRPIRRHDVQDREQVPRAAGDARRREQDEHPGPEQAQDRGPGHHSDLVCAGNEPGGLSLGRARLRGGSGAAGRG